MRKPLCATLKEKNMTTGNKPWLDRKDYPFKPNYFDLPMGKMHFVDEGQGLPIVFVNGNPGWSFEFRNSIIGFAISSSLVFVFKKSNKRTGAFNIFEALSDIIVLNNFFSTPNKL